MRAVRMRGFTLIELLVAVLITAIMFAMGYGALTQTLNSRKQVEAQSERLAKLQQAFRVIEQDLELIQPRPVRDLLGNGYLGAVYVDRNALASGGGSGTGTGVAPNGAVQVSFTRGSYANPAGLPRSELQRVSYLVRDGKLIRQQVPVLDATPATAPEERELLDQVELLGLRYLDESQVWSETWPTPILQRQTLSVQLRARPIAVEVTLRLKDYGTLTRIIEVIG
ncbi:MAG: type II secretion system minor pseudopilin GspJ [Gammaproteobacteria bacterium]|nr:type II secretion system minor pseudopilin GspJ [Gammaproteobacteria bacterium]MDE2252613.1 type II secretion system minor pseudopilin GspJ [Gammaproteobacteria bacterium]